MRRLALDEQEVILGRLPGILTAVDKRLQVSVPLGRPQHELWPLLGAARCLRLVQSMLALRADGFVDVIGVLARSHYETWAAAMYVCHGGQDAVDALAADFRSYLDGILSTLGTVLPDDSPEWLTRATPRKLSTLGLVSKLEDRLDELHPLKGYPKRAYKHLFAGESLRSSHGRVGSFLAYQAAAGDAIAILTTAPATPEGLDRIWEACSLMVCLSMDALQAIGEDVQDLTEMLDVIGLPAYPDR